jgi:glycine/D-amino acid oxidase-like deaminating enzyme
MTGGHDGIHASLRDAAPSVFWLDTPAAPKSRDPLSACTETDLLVVGGGFTGLWAALQAKEREPDRDVVLVEADAIAAHATGRNGGFCDASITHGLHNAVAHFPKEAKRLVDLGRENFAEIESSIDRYSIDAAFEHTGGLAVAYESWQMRDLEAGIALEHEHGEQVELLDREAMQSLVHSPTYVGGMRTAEGVATLDPARLAWGLADAAESLGVRIFEHTRVESLDAMSNAVVAETGGSRIRARKVVLGTNALSHLVGATRRRVVPVWDYVLVTEPLTDAQRASIGWAGREGIGDAANQFHYYRLTPDNRILWGGYDAIYYRGGDISDARSQRMQTFDLLAHHFFTTFPQLEGLRFTHRWGGVIDTSSRFCVTFGTAHDRRVSYAVGYTGLGVAATRFGARVALDLVDDPASALLRLDLVRSKPLPFPPEPLRSAVIQLTRRAIANADRNEGRRGPWLRLLDAFGVGFDS